MLYHLYKHHISSILTFISISDICLILLLGGATYMDIRYRKIYNFWILLWGILGVWILGFHFLIPVGMSIGVLFILFILRMMGAGDIKLVSLLFAYLGFTSGLQVLFISFGLSSVYAFYILYSKKILYTRLKYFMDYLRLSVNTKSIVKYYDIQKDGAKISIPMAPWFLLGFIIWRIYDICMMIQ